MAGSDTLRFPYGLRSPLGAFRLLDAVVGGYLVLASVPLAIGAARSIDGCATQLWVNLAALAGVALICALSRQSRWWFLVLLRLSYGPLLYATAYRQTATIWPVLQQLDAPLVSESDVIGTQPSLAFPTRTMAVAIKLFCSAYYAYTIFTPTMCSPSPRAPATRRPSASISPQTLCFSALHAVSASSPRIGPLLVPAALRPAAVPRLRTSNHLCFCSTSTGEDTAARAPSLRHLFGHGNRVTIPGPPLRPEIFPFMLAITMLIPPSFSRHTTPSTFPPES